MNPRSFRRFVRAVLFGVGPAAAAAACSSTTDMPDREPCIDATKPDRYQRLSLGADVDGIVFATRLPVAGAGASADDTTSRLVPVGAPCARATDRDACNRKVDELLPDANAPSWTLSTTQCSNCPSNVARDIAVITRGDEVRLATAEDVVRAAAPIDSAREATVPAAILRVGMDCDGNNVRPESDGWTFKRTNSSCDGSVTEIFTKITRNGERVTMGENRVSEGDNNCIEGRRPTALVATGAHWLDSLSACFAEIAHMEAASVLAFDALEADLRRLGAPPSLLARVGEARADEVRHAAQTTALAQRFGGTPTAPRLLPDTSPIKQGLRLRLAIENAVEGCVREAYGALLAAWQATHASDLEVRAVFRTIALDESRHAELSFALDAWLLRTLAPGERAVVEAAREDAWRDLFAACQTEPAPDVVTVAGMPSAAVARDLLAELRQLACAA